MSVSDDGSLYAIGCRTYTLLIDSRSLQLVKKIHTRYTGDFLNFLEVLPVLVIYLLFFCLVGVRSTSFKSDLLTIGSGVGVVMFYDLRIHRYLESGVNSARTVTLRTSRGYIVCNKDYFLDCFIFFRRLICVF